MRPFVAAAVQLAFRRRGRHPARWTSIAANLERCVEFTRRCVVATGAELVVLPESATTGVRPPAALAPRSCATWSRRCRRSRPTRTSLTETRCSGWRPQLGVHLCVGTYERGPERGTVYNAAVLIGPDGAVLGVYRKTHPFPGERRELGGWVEAGDDVCVVETPLGRIGMIICFDGDFPELARIEALLGAEVICRPSALLRSADIWELTSRARAYDNHVFLIGANATGMDPAGVIYFGNSHIVSPVAEIVAKASSHECWVSARLDLDAAMASLTPGSSVPQSFHHLRERNLALIRRYLPELSRAHRADPAVVGAG